MTRYNIFIFTTFLFISSLSAATLTFTDSVPLQTTNFNALLNISKFDPSLGTLNSVKITLLGNIEGDVRLESLDAQPSTITWELKAELKLLKPDTSTILIDIPLVSGSFNAAAFDGTIDFGGLSGMTLDDLTGTKTESITYTTPADKLLFIGVGSLSLSLNAKGMSTASGAGNLLTQFNVAAGASLEVIYDYNPIEQNPVPEPMNLLLLSLGLLALGFKMRK